MCWSVLSISTNCLARPPLWCSMQRYDAFRMEGKLRHTHTYEFSNHEEALHLTMKRVYSCSRILLPDDGNSLTSSVSLRDLRKAAKLCHTPRYLHLKSRKLASWLVLLTICIIHNISEEEGDSCAPTNKKNVLAMADMPLL